MIDLRKVYIKGMLARAKEREETDNYRGGNTGVQLSKDLAHAGSPNSCQRVLIARANGRKTEIDWRTQLMFDMGLANEDRWDAYLEAAGIKFTPEKDNKGMVNWNTSNGKKVTGSPDCIVHDAAGDFIIEHKHISSFWTFKSIVIDKQPKLDNLAQAAHYSLKTGLPATLVYTSSLMFSGPSFLTKMVPHPLDPGSEDFDYTYKKKNGKMYKGKPQAPKLNIPGNKLVMWPKDIFTEFNIDYADFKNTLPTIVQFDLRWVDSGDDKELEYFDGSEWQSTVITANRIEKFFNRAWQAEEEKVLPPRPVNVKPDGESKNYTACAFCSLSQVCDRYENDYDMWLKQALLVDY